MNPMASLLYTTNHGDNDIVVIENDLENWKTWIVYKNTFSKLFIY